MTGVDRTAWRPITALAYVPGVMALRSDTRLAAGVQYRPVPLSAGPICDQCWMGRRIVAPIGGVSRFGNRCRHTEAVA